MWQVERFYILSVPVVIARTSPHSIGTTLLPAGWVTHRTVSFLAA
jgi:hypothetical protein